jgi:hypothetical protein
LSFAALVALEGGVDQQHGVLAVDGPADVLGLVATERAVRACQERLHLLGRASLRRPSEALRNESLDDRPHRLDARTVLERGVDVTAEIGGHLRPFFPDDQNSLLALGMNEEPRFEHDVVPWRCDLDRQGELLVLVKSSLVNRKMPAVQQSRQGRSPTFHGQLPDAWVPHPAHLWVREDEVLADNGGDWRFVGICLLYDDPLGRVCLEDLEILARVTNDYFTNIQSAQF